MSRFRAQRLLVQPSIPAQNNLLRRARFSALAHLTKSRGIGTILNLIGWGF
jgi:hypothetical protein